MGGKVPLLGGPSPVPRERSLWPCLYPLSKVHMERLHAALHRAFLQHGSSLHKGAMEADCPELSAQQAPVNNYFVLALLVLYLLSSSPVNRRKTR